MMNLPHSSVLWLQFFRKLVPFNQWCRFEVSNPLEPLPPGLSRVNHRILIDFFGPSPEIIDVVGISAISQSVEYYFVISITVVKFLADGNVLVNGF